MEYGILYFYYKSACLEEKRMYCKNCGKEVNEGAVACLNCGADPRKKGQFCGNCGEQLNENAVVCIKCGSKVDGNSIADKLIGNVNDPDKTGNGMAIASMVLGIIGLAIGLCCCTYVGITCSALAIIFGILALRRNPTLGKAKAGLIMGIIGAALIVIEIIVQIVFFNSVQVYDEILRKLK